MDSIHLWLWKKIHVVKHAVFGFPEAEPALPDPWSMTSPFQKWNIYSKISFLVALVFFTLFIVLHCCGRTKSETKAISRRTSAPRLQVWPAQDLHQLDTWLYYLSLLLVVCLSISIPWEWVRLYQIEVAKKTSILSTGYGNSCHREDLSFWGTVKVWLSWNFSWNNNACEDYYKALLVDPFWEVTPVMAISSVMGRIILHPMETISHVVGRSIRNVMKEIPSQWQPVIFLLVPLVCVTVLAVAYFRRRQKAFVTYQVSPPNTRSKSFKRAIQSRT
ncbi:chloride channel CLIC-like protein 1 [Spea bombifrons]|uniref:chloride channel CLIC-like protein 1 n=1 Tax=Spea bombifrons TaxID=233779 RepID=UPI0023494204|nr:chloride channel CLIC-like protein 1 [Spea bombifrons]